MNTLYRLYDQTGRLLYVGASINAAGRLPAHRSKPWFKQVATAKFEHFETAEEAFDAETRAIQSESPRWNIAKTGRPPSVESRKKRSETMRRRREEHLAYVSSIYFTRDVTCTNCGKDPRMLKKGVRLEEHPCPSCDVAALEMKEVAA